MNIRLRLTLLLVLACLDASAFAASVSVLVIDGNDKPVPDAVIYAEPLSSRVLPKQPQTVAIEQKQRKFLPLVTAIEAGSAISFPNHDTVRHHVYSFSPAKTFELKLYSGVPAKPIVFDKAGTVVLGCNIHDKMVAYIHVVDTPYFAKTDDGGQAVLEALAAGTYQLRAWHYNLPPAAPIPQQALSVNDADSTASFRISLKADAVAH